MDRIRLIACDMDKTLLTDDNQFPPGFWEMAAELNEAGITFVPASGRPLLTLQAMFDHPDLDFAYISDNGAVTEMGGRILHESVMPPTAYMPIVEATVHHTDGVPVVCTAEGGYSTPEGEEYGDYIGRYFKNLQFVDDLSDLPSPAVKVSAYFHDETARDSLETTYLPRFGEQFAVTLGGDPWVDVTNLGVTKGSALLALAQSLGVGRAEMMAFGDALNDVSMLEAVDHSYAMANADPAVIESARYTAPSNRDHGVMAVVSRVLQQQGVTGQAEQAPDHT